jgi:hypothetical protein
MAKNTGKGFRRGAVTGRTQFQHDKGDWQKRDERTGEFVERTAGPKSRRVIKESSSEHRDALKRLADK